MRDKLKKKWAERAERYLLGLRITKVEYLSDEECEKFGWDRCPVAIQLDNEIWLIPMANDEGNGGGALSTNLKNLPVIPVISGGGRVKIIDLIRCYDNGGMSMDRFTVIFLNTNKKVSEKAVNYDCLCMSENPNSPVGVCIHGTAQLPNPAVGMQIEFTDLPFDCQLKVREDLQI